MAIDTAQPPATPPKQSFLQRVLPINSKGYYAFLAVISVFILGPLAASPPAT